MLGVIRNRLLGVAGCAAVFIAMIGCASPANEKGSANAATAPATQPFSGQVLRLDDARPINTSADAQPSLDLQNKVTSGGQTVYFGLLETYDGDDLTGSIPVLARRDGQRILGLPVRSDGKSNEAWAYVGSGPTAGEIWGIVDSNVDDRTSDLLMVHSGDNGHTFVISHLHKPLAAAQFDSFSMSREGVGRVTVYISRADAGRHGAGYYNYRTHDGGRTWALGEYEHDSMVPADDVPDSDQPSGVMRVSR